MNYLKNKTCNIEIILSIILFLSMIALPVTTKASTNVKYVGHEKWDLDGIVVSGEITLYDTQDVGFQIYSDTEFLEINAALYTVKDGKQYKLERQIASDKKSLSMKTPYLKQVDKGKDLDEIQGWVHFKTKNGKEYKNQSIKIDIKKGLKTTSRSWTVNNKPVTAELWWNVYTKDVGLDIYTTPNSGNKFSELTGKIFTDKDKVIVADEIKNNGSLGTVKGIQPSILATKIKGYVNIYDYGNKHEGGWLTIDLNKYDLSFIKPCTYTRISSTFGDSRGSRSHKGIDLATPTGTKLVASEKGKIIEVKTYYDYTNKKYYSYGKKIVIDHGNGFKTLYAHMNSVSVKVGDTVCKGQKIGETGNLGNSSGSHLHFEIRHFNTPKNPKNYIKF